MATTVNIKLLSNHEPAPTPTQPDKTASHSIVGPQQEFIVGQIFRVDEVGFKAFSSGTKTLVVCIGMTYADIFHKPRFVEIRSIAGKTPRNTWALQPTIDGTKAD